jgi:hypothetical protein
MTIAAAVSVFTGITPLGVVTNFGLDLPSGVDNHQMPALLFDMNSLFEPVLKPSNVTLTAGKATVSAIHGLMICSLEALNADPGHYQALRLTLVDTYMAAMMSDPLLSDNLLTPLAITSAYWTPFDYAGVGYYGVRFVHSWEIRYATS